MVKNKAWIRTGVVVLLFAPQAMAGMLIGINGDFLCDIDTTTGLATNPRFTGDAARAIAFGDGTLHGTSVFTLSTINPATGQTSELGQITGLVAPETIIGGAWDPENDALAALVHVGGTLIDLLYSIDPSSLTATLVGEFDASYDTISLDPGGRLFAIDPVQGLLGMIDKVSAATISQTPLSPDIFRGGSGNGCCCSWYRVS